MLCSRSSLLADGLRALLAEQADFEIVGAVRRQHILSAVQKHTPDVVVVLSPELTIADTGELGAISAHAKVVLIARPENVCRAMEAIRVGVSAVVAPDSRAQALLQTLRTVAEGESFVLPATARIDTGAQHPEASPATLRLAAALTQREKEILLLLVRGSSNAEIAANLSVSTTTIRSHVHHLLGKLELSTRTQAVAVAYESGLLAVVEREFEQHQLGTRPNPTDRHR